MMIYPVPKGPPAFGFALPIVKAKSPSSEPGEITETAKRPKRVVASDPTASTSAPPAIHLSTGPTHSHGHRSEYRRRPVDSYRPTYSRAPSRRRTPLPALTVTTSTIAQTKPDLSLPPKPACSIFATDNKSSARHVPDVGHGVSRKRSMDHYSPPHASAKRPCHSHKLTRAQRMRPYAPPDVVSPGCEPDYTYGLPRDSLYRTLKIIPDNYPSIEEGNCGRKEKRRNSSGNSKKLTAADCVPGRIIYIKKQFGNDYGWTAHPGLIAGQNTLASGGFVPVMGITNWGNQDIFQKWGDNMHDKEKAKRCRRRYLLIEHHDAPTHDDMPVLELSGGKMPKQSYLDLYWVRFLSLDEIEKYTPAWERRDLELANPARDFKVINQRRDEFLEDIGPFDHF